MRYGADATALDKLGRYCVHNYDMFCSMPFIVPTTIINFVLILLYIRLFRNLVLIMRKSHCWNISNEFLMANVILNNHLR